jgi:acid phosphatase
MNLIFRHAAPLAVCWILALWSQGCSTSPKPAHHYFNVDATLWAQTAAEHDSAVAGVFAAATQRLEALAGNTNFTSCLEQETDRQVAIKPVAIIADIDETLLDNSPFEGELAWRGIDFDKALWRDWVLMAKAMALPGAVEFCRAARAKGITILYVTNRGDSETPEEREAQEQATRRNLMDQGFPITEAEDAILTPGERPGWGSDKTTRRAFLAERYRIIALLGDDLGDFMSVGKLTVEERKAAAAKMEERWGTAWFMVPNPMYGSWLRAITKSQPPLDPMTARLRKLGRMDPRGASR